jgi:2-polyprenyl-3-methyl-5-hydroxy-6-metoxy-1,4-benzoquinol methylase
MSPCRHGCYDSQFDVKRATKDLRRYRRKGPDKTTRLLLNALRAEGVQGMSVLDVGGGVGIVHHELLTAGARAAVHVDAATPYIRAAEEEAARRGHAERVSFVHGDFVAIASEITPADVVTLDRVICCYPDMERLVAASASRARHLYGAVFPRESRLLKVAFTVGNLLRRLRGSAFRTYLHSTRAIDSAVQREGLRPRSVRDTTLWRVAVYARSA